MGFHHLALACRDTRATHTFYTEATGFELVKVDVGGTPEGGWAKHFFYDTGGDGLLAFWELHDDSLPEAFETGISDAAGLPKWVNHVAFAAADTDDIQARMQRWLRNGYDVLEIDHGWCVSIYTVDPNGTLVEFCVTTQDFDENDRAEAARLLADPQPPLRGDTPVKHHRAEGKPLHKRLDA